MSAMIHSQPQGTQASAQVSASHLLPPLSLPPVNARPDPLTGGPTAQTDHTAHTAPRRALPGQGWQDASSGMPGAVPNVPSLLPFPPFPLSSRPTSPPRDKLSFPLPSAPVPINHGDHRSMWEG
jgi:hypothetical protein